ncbi:uncharacterized protein LOC128199286 [Bicyclus anynana]|uniref:Uncharacterized protein LOC128199286 n=1 Tax=Bicyclus anynana TaxID=110368 RepID=A0ABM3LYJ6_BICAN|nr:uncharacterized protein LOC128199286 [Bicyclus anynana]
MAGKSTETALHNLVVRIERSINYKEFALGCFFDVEGAFDRANRRAIEFALNRDGIDDIVKSWIMNMLTHRLISADLGGETQTVRSTRGFPQGGCLSPLLWCLLLDSLIVKINDMRIYMQAYSDDGVLLVTGRDLHTVRNIMCKGIKNTLAWCREKGLNLNPFKTKLVLFTRRRKAHLIPITIEGVKLEITKEIKYLGVILDHTLRFRTHIQVQCAKAKLTLMQCRRAVGRTWGIKPKVIKWIYTAIILPRVLYGATVWWHRAAIKSNSKELTKVQRLASLMISGAIRTTPSAALEVLLGLYPLDLRAKKNALEQWYRMKVSKQWKGNFMDKGHTDIDKVYGDKLSMIINNNDLIKRQRIFDKKYRVHIGSKDTWQLETAHECSIVCYTDGSRRESTKLSGAGVFYSTIPNKDQAISLGKFASVFQAETYAIMVCAFDLMDLADIETKEIVIYSDSQAALKALKRNDTTSALVRECKNILNSLAEKTKVTIAWVPGHQGNYGNEKADELARMGAGLEFLGPEPCLPIPYSIIKRVIEGIIERESNTRWNSSTKCRQSKMFLKSFDKKKTTQLLLQSRLNIALVAGMTTGHCLLNRHLKIMKIIEDSSCPGCGEEETSYHFIAECPMFALVRWELLGKDTLNEVDLTNLSIGDIVRFTKATGRFEGGTLSRHQ